MTRLPASPIVRFALAIDLSDAPSRAAARVLAISALGASVATALVVMAAGRVPTWWMLVVALGAWCHASAFEAANPAARSPLLLGGWVSGRGVRFLIALAAFLAAVSV